MRFRRKNKMREWKGAGSSLWGFSEFISSPRCSLAFHSIGTCLVCFPLVVRTAETPTVARIEASTAVPDLANMIGEHPILRCCPSATLAMVGCLAPCASTLDDMLGPSGVSGGAVVRVGLSSWHPQRAGIEHRHQRAQHAQLGHLSPPVAGRGCQCKLQVSVLPVLAAELA
jgi:hypothetical protein